MQGTTARTLSASLTVLVTQPSKSRGLPLEDCRGGQAQHVLRISLLAPTSSHHSQSALSHFLLFKCEREACALFSLLSLVGSSTCFSLLYNVSSFVGHQNGTCTIGITGRAVGLALVCCTRSPVCTTAGLLISQSLNSYILVGVCACSEWWTVKMRPWDGGERASALRCHQSIMRPLTIAMTMKRGRRAPRHVRGLVVI